MAQTSNHPVFVVGAERSGSMLLSLMLGHHPQLAWNLGFEFAVEMLSAPGVYPPLADYHRYLETTLIFQVSRLKIAPQLPYPELIQDFVRQEMAAARKPRFGATVHLHFDRLRWLFPSCRFIHLVRDPRDVSRSRVQMGWAGNVWTAAQSWLTAEKLWQQVRPTLKDSEAHEVRYERLVAEPEATLRGICDFIGVPYAPQMLSYPDDTNYSAPDRNLSEAWKRLLSRREVQLVEARLDNLLQASGYTASGLPGLRLGWWGRLWLRQDDRYRRVRFRIERNGWFLTAADFIARHLGFTSWARRLRLQLNAIAIRHMK